MAFFFSGDQMKEESDKLKHGGEKKSALEVAFGAPRKNLLDDLLSVQEQMAEKCHAFQRVIEQEIVPAIEGMVCCLCVHIYSVTWEQRGGVRSPWLRSADALLWLYVSFWYDQMARFNSSMDQILKDGEEYLEDMELAEANVQMAYRDYREQVHIRNIIHSYIF